MSRLTLIPCAYLVLSRLTRPKDWIFIGLYEWGTMCLFAICNGGLSSLALLGPSYFIFVSVYELGYLHNDLLAHREASHQTTRPPVPEGRLFVAMFIATRLISVATLVALARSVEVAPAPGVVLFYILLLLIFTIHNIIPPALRLGTFFSLATLRFSLPLLTASALQAWPSILVFSLLAYTPYRHMNYMKSKGLLSSTYFDSPLPRSVFCTPPLGILFAFAVVLESELLMACGSWILLLILASDLVEKNR